MIEKSVLSIINNYSGDEELLNQIVVTSFIKSHFMPPPKEGFLSKYYIDILDSSLLFTSEMEDIIEIFELAIPNRERVMNGAVYTPKYIRNYIVDTCFEKTLKSINKPLSEWLCADISCGCGAFLYTVTEKIRKCDKNIEYKSIIRHLYGIDISEVSVNRAKILLSLMALQNGEIMFNEDFNIFVGDSLIFNFKKMNEVAKNSGFDVIVGNPPYVRSKHIENKTKAQLSRWSTSNCGNVDLYIPFFEIALGLLSDGGYLGYITVNSFFKAVNARKLRTYFSTNRTTLKIINFGQELIFKKKLAYTCIIIASNYKTESIEYLKASSKDIMSGIEQPANKIPYEKLNNHKGWHLNNNIVLENIEKIESAGKTLGDSYVIKNGLATLANDIYIFKPIFINQEYYYLSRSGVTYPIEKGICRDIIKPNILKTELELEDKKEKIIYPYDSNMSIYDETYISKKYPHAYNYLLNHKSELSKRDKGEGSYPAWYAFGRTQAIDDHGIRLFFPYMTDHPHFVLSLQKDLLMYCGYAIFSENIEDLKVLKRILESIVFDYYIKNTSKPYSSGFYSYAKNYVKNFGIVNLSNKKREHLLSLKSKDSIDKYLCELYGLPYNAL